MCGGPSKAQVLQQGTFPGPSPCSVGLWGLLPPALAMLQPGLESQMGVLFFSAEKRKHFQILRDLWELEDSKRGIEALIVQLVEYNQQVTTNRS